MSSSIDLVDTNDISEGLVIDKLEDGSYPGVGQFVSGTITVKTAVAAGFLFIVATGIQVKIDKSVNGTTFKISYDGLRPVKELMAAFAKNKPVKFTNKKN